MRDESANHHDKCHQNKIVKLQQKAGETPHGTVDQGENETAGEISADVSAHMRKDRDNKLEQTCRKPVAYKFSQPLVDEDLQHQQASTNEQSSIREPGILDDFEYKYGKRQPKFKLRQHIFAVRI